MDIKKVFKKALSIENENILYKVTETSTSMNKIRKKEFISSFINNCLLDCIKHFSKCENSHLEIKFTRSLQHLLFHKLTAKQVEAELNLFFEEDSNRSLDSMRTHLEWLRSCRYQSPKLIYFVFKAFLFNFKKDSSLVSKYFFVLCHLIGFEKDVVVQVGGVKKNVVVQNQFTKHINVKHSVKDDKYQESCEALKSLFDVLNEDIVELSSEVNGVLFLSWLQTLVTVVAKTDDLTSLQLDMIRSIVTYNPMVAESCIEAILFAVFQQHETVFTSEFVMSYSNLLQNILKSFAKFQRVDKFIQLYLLHLRKRTQHKPNSIVFLTQEILTEFSSIVTLAPTIQCLNIFETLKKNFKLDSVKSLDNTVLMVEIECKLLSIFIESVKILDHTLPKSVVNSFYSKWVELEGCLGDFGTQLLFHPHDDHLMFPYLDLCYNVGDLNMFWQFYKQSYDPSHQETTSAVMAGNSPTNLSQMHSYLQPHQWDVIAERVANFGSDECKTMLLKLLFQKLKAFSISPNLPTSSLEVVTNYLSLQLTHGIYEKDLMTIDPQDMNILMTSLSPQQALQVTDKLLELITQQNKEYNYLYCNETMKENKVFIRCTIASVLAIFAANLKNKSKLETILDKASKKLCSNKLDLESLKNECHDSISNRLELNSNINVNSSMVLKCFQVLKNLPLEYVDVDLHVTVGLTTLALHTVAPELQEECVDILLSLFEGRKSEIFEYFHIGLLIKYLTVFCFNANNFYKLIESIISSVRQSEESVQQLSKCVSFLRKKLDVDAEEHYFKVSVLLQRSLIKSVRKKEINQYLMKFRNKLSKKIFNILEHKSANNDEALLEGYCVEFQRTCASNNAEQLARIYQLNFQQYFNTAECILKTNPNNRICLDFVSTILRYYPRIRCHVGGDIIQSIWKNIQESSEPQTVCVQLLYQHSTEEEFRIFVDDVCQNAFKLPSQEELNPLRLKVHLSIFGIFLSQQSPQKMAICQNNLQLLFLNLLLYKSSLSSSCCIYKLFNILLCNRQIQLTTSILDTIFQYIADCPLQDNNQLITSLFTCSLDVTANLINSRSELIMDRIPSIFQLFDRYLNVLVLQSDTRAICPPDDVHALTSCAFLLDKVCSFMTKQKKDFSRVGSYFIANIVTSFENATLHQQVKVHLKNCIFHLLSISDAHSIAFLLTTLPSSSQRIFQSIYKEFNKFYKFKGRI